MTTALDGNSNFDPLTLSEDECHSGGKRYSELGENIDHWVGWRPRSRHERVLLKGLIKPLPTNHDELTPSEGSKEEIASPSYFVQSNPESGRRSDDQSLVDRLRDDLEPYSAAHSNIESLISEKSIDKYVEPIGVNDQPRRKSK